MFFTELDLNDSILDALDAMRFEQCTPIQEKSIPPLLKGCDLIGVAQTGTGKTAAYLLPILNKISDGGYPEDAVNCIIMAPTRELAQQIDQAMQGFSYFMPVSSVAVYGGNDGILFTQQKRGLTKGADVVIATPGRLISHIQMGYVDLSRVSFFVLDEADRMLDMGFYDDIMQIVKLLPKERQTIMFSATMPEKIQQLAHQILTNPVEVKIAVSRPAEKIKQRVYYCYEKQKLALVRSLFQHKEAKRVLIFASKKVKVKEVARSLRQMGMNVGEMHSDLEQAKREEVMLAFKNGHISILVATDIVSRGIDIDDIQIVINFDVPHDYEDYVHRIGRTARAGAEGEALTFVSPDDLRYFRQIENFLRYKVEPLNVPKELGGNAEIKDDQQKPQISKGKEGRKHKAGPRRFKRSSKTKPAGAKTERGKTKKQDKPKEQ